MPVIIVAALLVNDSNERDDQARHHARHDAIRNCLVLAAVIFLVNSGVNGHDLVRREEKEQTQE